MKSSIVKQKLRKIHSLFEKEGGERKERKCYVLKFERKKRGK